MGIGTTMLLHCDQVIASDTAVLLTPFVSLGLLPEAGFQPDRAAAHGTRARIFAAGDGQVTVGRRGKTAGIVNAVVPAAELDAQALAAAREIAALPPESVAAARRLMRGSVEEIVARIDEEVEAFKTRLASPEAQEAFAAFLNQKR